MPRATSLTASWVTSSSKLDSGDVAWPGLCDASLDEGPLLDPFRPRLGRRGHDSRKQQVHRPCDEMVDEEENVEAGDMRMC